MSRQNRRHFWRRWEADRARQLIERGEPIDEARAKAKAERIARSRYAADVGVVQAAVAGGRAELNDVGELVISFTPNPEGVVRALEMAGYRHIMISIDT